MSMNAKIFAMPHDMLFVGPPSSADAGETHRVVSLFPPPPTTFQGAVRTHILRTGKVPLHGAGSRAVIESAVGYSDKFPDGCNILGPWVAERLWDDRKGDIAEVWLPVPRWCQETEHRIAPQRAAMDTAADVKFSRASMVPLMPVRGGKPCAGWVRAGDLAELIQGVAVPKERLSKLPAGIVREKRPGLLLTSQRTAEQGMFYVHEGYRFPREVGLLADIKWTGKAARKDAVTKGAMTIGAKQRVAAVSEMDGLARGTRTLWAGPQGQEAPGQDECLAWVYLASPAHLENAVAPEWPALGGEMTVETVTCALDKPLMLGGRRMVERTARALKPYVPAGSGWLVRVRGGTARDRAAALKSWHGTAMMGRENEKAMGCGVVLIGYCDTGNHK